MMTVTILRVNPLSLRLSGLYAEPFELSLAGAPDDASVRRRPDAAGFAAGRLRPSLCRVIECEAGGRHARHDDSGVVLLRCVQQVRILLVDADHVEFGGRLIQDTR